MRARQNPHFFRTSGASRPILYRSVAESAIKVPISCGLEDKMCSERQPIRGVVHEPQQIWRETVPSSMLRVYSIALTIDILTLELGNSSFLYHNFRTSCA